MKKIILTLFCLIVTAVRAQNIEELKAKNYDTDPMLGSSGGTAWISEHVGLWLPGKGGDLLRLLMKDHIFVKNYDTKIGFYSADNTLIGVGFPVKATPTQDGKRMDLKVFFSNDSLPYSEYSENDYVIKKSWRVRVSDVFRWLKENDGYIRITTLTYGGYLYDVRFRLKKEE